MLYIKVGLIIYYAFSRSYCIQHSEDWWQQQTIASSTPLQAAQDVNDEGTLPGDSKAQIIPTSEGSPSLHPIQIEESYSLAG